MSVTGPKFGLDKKSLDKKSCMNTARTSVTGPKFRLEQKSLEENDLALGHSSSYVYDSVYQNSD